MDKSVVDQYLAEIPYQVRLAVKPLSNDKSWAILIALLKDGNMRFSNIKRKFGADSSGDIDRILKQLIQSGLITKHATNYDEIFDNTKSIYSATPIGAAVIHSLNRALSPSFNHTFMDNMQNQQIVFGPSMQMDEVPNNLKVSVQAHIPPSYKFIIKKSPAVYGKNSHIITNKEPIPI